MCAVLLHAFGQLLFFCQEAREDRNQARALQARAQAMVASAESKAEVLTEAGRLIQSGPFWCVRKHKIE